ncbi:MAG: hypothetical protein EZS28_013284 [Streblomastix strix]|uniref:Uncharacterized protein n=1 Tax=Streblomastix strix TaxID=222440 RepID=A0A5J4W9Y5_9EUKA|nr:MAG: hypothetical protein EZS28_013284 [Streblomastix strix]
MQKSYDLNNYKLGNYSNYSFNYFLDNKSNLGQIAKSSTGEVKAYSLELMLLIVEREVSKVQKEVRNAIGDIGLLLLIRESDITLNERTINQSMK